LEVKRPLQSVTIPELTSEGFITAILINTGAIGGDYIGFRYWAHPGPIANGINGFGQCFLLAAVYYCGTEMLAITAVSNFYSVDTWVGRS
jgi:hypothetical protein